MTFRYLDFDYSEDDEGTATWDAIASVAAEHAPALQAEIAAILQWAHAEFAGLQGPVEDGGAWDYDLQSEQTGQPLQALRFNVDTRRLAPLPAPAPGQRQTLTLSISGGPAFAMAFRERFALE